MSPSYVWPKIVYCYFTRTTFLLNCLRSELVVSITSPSVVALLLLVSEIAQCIT